MAIARNSPLLAGAKGNMGKSCFTGAASTPAAVSVRLKVSSPAPLLRLLPLRRSPAAPRSLAVVRVARHDSSDTGDSMDRMDRITAKKPEIKTKAIWMCFVGLMIWIGVLAVKWRMAAF